MQLQWRRALGINEGSRTVMSYVFGPCLMIEYRQGECNQVKRKFIFDGKHFKDESAMIHYIDSKAHGK